MHVEHRFYSFLGSEQGKGPALRDEGHKEEAGSLLHDKGPADVSMPSFCLRFWKDDLVQFWLERERSREFRGRGPRPASKNSFWSPRRTEQSHPTPRPRYRREQHPAQRRTPGSQALPPPPRRTRLSSVRRRVRARRRKVDPIMRGWRPMAVQDDPIAVPFASR